MNIQSNLTKEIEKDLVKFLESYKQIYKDELFEFYIVKGDELFEIYGKYKNEFNRKGEDDIPKLDECIILRMNTSSQHKQIQIFNIFLPKFMKYQGIGKKIIFRIFSLTEKYDYELFIVDMVNSFYNKMINRGATPCDQEDVVLITKDTKLI